MAQLKITNMSFCYPDSSDFLFEDISLSLDTAWRLGFVGRNGRGKTTLLKILAGELPYSGSISSPLPVTYFPYPVDEEKPSLLEALQEALPSLEDWAFEKESSLLSLDSDVITRKPHDMSRGERTKAYLSAMFAVQERFWLIDEPTNHLDAEARKLLSAYLKRKQGFILVSHDQTLLDSCTDHTLSINKTNITLTKGSVSVWLDAEKNRNVWEASENERLRGEISRLSEAARQTSSWADKAEKSKIGNGPVDRGYIGHKSAKMMKRSKAAAQRLERAAEEKSSLLNNVENEEAVKLMPLTWRSNPVIEAAGLQVRYNSSKKGPPVTFQLNIGDRLALTGKNGAGKTSLLRIFAAENLEYTGLLRIPPGLIVSAVPQDSANLSGNLADFAAGCGVSQSIFFTNLAKLGLEAKLFNADLKELSDGQRKKVLLAASLAQSAHVYLWDEPLNFIDLISRRQLEDVIIKASPTMIFIEHDETFLANVATGFISLKP